MLLGICLKVWKLWLSDGRRDVSRIVEYIKWLIFALSDSHLLRNINFSEFCTSRFIFTPLQLTSR